jgi:hypothetical protein
MMRPIFTRVTRLGAQLVSQIAFSRFVLLSMIVNTLNSTESDRQM